MQDSGSRVRQIDRVHAGALMAAMTGVANTTHGARRPHLSLLNSLKTSHSLSCMWPIATSTKMPSVLCTLWIAPMVPIPMWNLIAYTSRKAPMVMLELKKPTRIEPKVNLCHSPNPEPWVRAAPPGPACRAPPS